MILVVFYLASISSALAGPLYPYSVRLNFTASTSMNVKGYNMYRASFANDVCDTFVKLNTVPFVGIIYTDSSPLQGLYCYKVTAVSTDGIESIPSNIVQNINIPPPPPTNFTEINQTNGDPEFSWTQSTGTSLTSNWIWCGPTSGGPYTAWGSTAHPAITVTFIANAHWYKRISGTTYCVVTVLSSTNGFSGYSNEVSTTF